MPDPTAPAGADDLRDRYAEAIALSLNGPATDGQGWYHTAAERVDCYVKADAVMAVRDAELERLRAELAALRTDETDVDWLADHVRTAVHYVLGRIEPRLDSKVRTEAAEQASIHIRAGSVPFVNARVMDLAIDLIKQAEAERDALKAAIELLVGDWKTRARKAESLVNAAMDAVSEVRWNVWRTAYECLATEMAAALATLDTAPETPEASE